MTYEELLKDKLEEYHYDEDTIIVSTAFLDMFSKLYAKEKCSELLEIVVDKADPTDFGYAVSRYSIMNAVDLDNFIV